MEKYGCCFKGRCLLTVQGFMRSVRKFFMVLLLVASLTAGYFSMNVLTACRAEAQARCCSGVCIYAGSGIIQAIQAIDLNVIYPVLAPARDQIVAHFLPAVDLFREKAMPLFPWVSDQITRLFDTIWYYNYLPALQLMTDQLTTAIFEQSWALGAFTDAAALNRIERSLEDMAIRDHREQRPGENVCVAASTLGGMTRVTALARAYNTAAPTERLPRSSNQLGSSSEDSGRNDVNARWQTYITRYCRLNFNAAFSGCAADQPFYDQDLDVAGNIFTKDTIQLNDGTGETKRIIDDLIVNLAEPFVSDPIPFLGDVEESGAKADLLARDREKTQRQLIYDSLYHVVAQRAPGSNTAAFIQQVRGEATPGITSALNPSRREVLRALIADRFRSGRYAFRQIGEPENNRREMVIQQALQVMQLRDQLDLMDRQALLLAGQIGHEVTDGSPSDAAAEGAPLSGP